MSNQNVAVEGDVQAVIGTTPLSPATQGTWTASPITYSAYSKLQIGNKPVIYKAECTFTFNGTEPLATTPPSTKPVTGSEKVTLIAGSTKLQNGASSVLVNGNETPGGQHGNQLKVVTSNKVLSS